MEFLNENGFHRAVSEFSQFLFGLCFFLQKRALQKPGAMFKCLCPSLKEQIPYFDYLLRFGLILNSDDSKCLCEAICIVLLSAFRPNRWVLLIKDVFTQNLTALIFLAGQLHRQ